MTRYVYSLDYDGCIAEASIELIIQHNEALIKELITLVENGHEVVLGVGSNRQDIHKDYKISKGDPRVKRQSTPSVFSAIPAIVNEVKKRVPSQAHLITFDGFLTVDWQHKEKPGSQFAEYSKLPWVQQGSIPSDSDVPDEKRFKTQETDETKISTLYAQLHYFAQQNPGPQVFTLEDDRADILALAFKIFSENKTLVPNNITFKFKQKFSQELTKGIESDRKVRNDTPIAPEYTPFTGEGTIDPNFGETAKAMMLIAHIIGNPKLPETSLNDVAPDLIKRLDTIYREFPYSGEERTGYQHPKFMEIFNAYKQLKQAKSMRSELDAELILSFSMRHPELISLGKGLLIALAVVAVVALAIYLAPLVPGIVVAVSAAFSTAAPAAAPVLASAAPTAGFAAGVAAVFGFFGGSDSRTEHFLPPTPGV